VTALAVVVAIGVIAFATRPTGGTDGPLVEPPTQYAALRTDGTVVGSASAPVVVEVYSDFQCPACKAFVTQQLPRLLTDYVTPGVARIESHDIAFLGRGTPDESLELAAGASCAAEQGRYWPFHDLVFWNQGHENVGDHDADFIRRVAIAAELDMTKWDACFGRSDVRPPIKSATSAATGAGISQTPTIRVNGQPIVGVPPYDQLAALIQQQAAAAGTPAPATGAPSAGPS